MTIEDFKKEVLPLKNKIFRFAKRLMNIHEEAEDITQDVFMKLWNKKEELMQYRSIEALAMTVTKNLCLDKIKSKKTQTVELNNNNRFITEANPYKHAETADNMALMNRIIDSLPEQQKIIIQLREIEGYEFEEIVSITGLNINVIRVNLSRARQKIKEELTKNFNYGLKIN